MKDLLQKTHLRALMLVVLMLCGVGTTWGAEETVTFSEQGYENAQEITSYNGTNFSIAFDKGTNSSVPKYYTSGTAIRAYGGNTFTVSSNNNKITKIEITFGTSDGSNAIKVDGESISNGKWTGSASSVKFTIDGTSGNRRLSAITVTTGNETATPTITASNVTLAYDATEGEIEYSISNPADGEQLTASTDASWISNINVASGKVTFETTTNEGQGDRTASITLSYPNATNKIVTVTQEHFVIDYVTLPFAWEGGTKNNLTALTGVKGYGLGSDYADSHGQYRVKFDNDGDYIQIKTNEQPGKVTIGVKMIGGATTSKITVQGSADGETFRDIQELTIKGASNQILTLETTNDFDSSDRYVRLIFTKGSNVGVGPISISKPLAVKTPVISLAAGNYFETQNVTISCETNGTTIYYTLDGTEPSATNGTQYTAPFTINSSAALKAIAIKGDDASAVASATYTFPVTYNNIAALVEAAPTETVILTLTDAQVLYVNNKDMYVKDATGALDFYNCGLEYTAGQILNGTAVVNYQLYTNGLPEITSVDVENSNFSATDGVATPEVVSAAELTLANDICKLVQVKGNYDNKAIDGVSVYNKWGINDIDLDNFSASVAKAVGIVVPSKEGTPNIALISIEEVPVVAQIGTQKFETLQAAVDAAYEMTGDVTIELIDNIEGYSIIKQKAGLNLTIDGKENTVNGQIIIDGDGRGTGTETLTIQNVKFEGDGTNFCSGTSSFVEVPSTKTAGTPYYTNKYNYAHDITITDCSFTSTTSDLTMAAIRSTSGAGLYNVTISNSTGTNLHSLAQLTGTTGGTVTNNTVDNSESFINVNGGDGEFTVSGNTFTSAKTDDGYAVRENGSSTAVITLTNNNFTAYRVVQLGKGNSATAGTFNIESGNHIGAVHKEDAATGKIAISGGTYSVEPDAEFIVEGYVAAKQGDVYVVIPESDLLAAPIIFHDGGEYEGALKVAMAGQGTIKYTLNGGAEQTYSAPINVSETTTITAWTESNGVKSDEVSKTFTISAATAGPAVEDKYYTIKNNGNNKYVNVAGRKTVTFVDETATAAGTVIRVKANDKGQVQILRSQGVDIPGYAEKAMNYVPKIVELIVDKLHAEGSGELLGENGLDAIMAKFKESFDYHLYLEEANGGYRIYGRTPSMQPVVDFYAENKANVDAKLPGLEAFINSAIEKVLQKTNGSGASILVPFSLQTVWEKMGSTLTKPEDEASTAKFYEEVLSSEANVWNFAYETAMIYWTKLKEHPKFQDNLDKLGDYAKYIDKVENIRPNFKYYIVQKNDQLDFISQGNSELNAEFTTWTLAERTDFSVAFPEENVKNAGKEHYTTLYTDFAYTLPEGVKAYKVTAINETTGVATTEEISGTIPAQTPVLLSTTNEELTQTLTLNVNDAGSAPTDNLLVGPDYLINTYNIKTAQIADLFEMAKAILGDDAYATYLSEYEHLMLKNSGTVNNKYFFGLDDTDLELCTYKNEDDMEDCVVRSLSTGDEKLGFYNNWEVKANQAFLVNEKFNPVKLTLKGDVTRDGLVNVNDVTATVDITLNKATLETHSDIYDFDAADADDSGAINVTDVIIIVNLSLGKE